MDHAHTPNVLAHCPVCHAAYPASDVRLLSAKGAIRLFHCTCSSCGNAVMALVLENAGSLSSVGTVTDLEIQDALRFQGAPLISADECVMAHRVVQKESRKLCARLLDKAS